MSNDLKEKLVSAFRELIGEDAEAVTAEILKRGEGEKYLEPLTHEETARGIRTIIAEQRNLLPHVREKRIREAEEKYLRAPQAMSDSDAFALRGGQPGNWFANEPAYDGGFNYEPAGGAARPEMEKRLRSAFAK